jgi:hypothetical protein
MKHILALALLSSVVLSSVVLAEEAATPEVKPPVVIAKGKQGQAPVQVVYDYLQDRISDEYGLSEYQNLQISQKTAKAEDYKNVSLNVVKAGLGDDSTASQRYQFALAFNDEAQVWAINSVKQDWQCRRSKAWTQKPCK